MFQRQLEHKRDEGHQACEQPIIDGVDRQLVYYRVCLFKTQFPCLQNATHRDGDNDVGSSGQSE